MKKIAAILGLASALTVAVAAARAADQPAFKPLPASTNAAPRARIVVVEDPEATEFFQPRADHVRQMVARGITAITRKADVKTAWLSLVNPTNMVAIKVLSAPGSVAGTRLAVVAAVVEELLEAGIPATNLIVWDKRHEDLERAGFVTLADRYGIRVLGASDAGYDRNTYYDNALMGRLALNQRDLIEEVGGSLTGRRSNMTRLLTSNSLKLISISPLLTSNSGGTSGHLLSLALGAMDNTRRFESSPSAMAVAVPEIFTLPSIADHTVLHITDALVGQFLGEEEPRLHYSTEVRQLWFSRDPVALDSMAGRELARARNNAGIKEGPSNDGLYRVASAMELGVNDAANIDVEHVR